MGEVLTLFTYLNKDDHFFAFILWEKCLHLTYLNKLLGTSGSSPYISLIHFIKWKKEKKLNR